MVVALLFSAAGGCVYYNTFYNARKSFNEAEKSRNKSKGKGRGNVASYRKAIEKSLKVIEDYPNSKYYDDALYVLMVSYYYTEQYSRSERRAREILAVYAESEYALDATLYLAKAKLMQKDVDDAVGIFQEIFEGAYDAQFKSEAAMTLGAYHFDNKEYRKAEPYFLALRDSLGNAEERRLAQTYLADGYFAGYRFQDALGAYLQLLGMDPDKNEKYHALFQAANSSYRLQRIDDGQDYLMTLMDEDVYFDSVSVLMLKMGEGYEFDEELAQAEAYYQDIINQSEKSKVKAQAFWRLALIYQYDYDDLVQAKIYYDSTSKLDRSSDIGKDALHRSSSIGLLEAYSRAIEIDSTSTQDIIDRAAYTQYQLAELYWIELNKPDSALIAMQVVADSFPTAFDSPKALIALSEMVREYEEDSSKADSILREVLIQYPTSDYLPEALERLGLAGSSADTGYAGVYFSRAEHFVVDEFNLDSARANYQVVADRFPDSKYFLQSRFALVWLTETYDNPGDSSVIWAYKEISDSFPSSNWANEARRRTQYVAKKSPSDDDQEADSVMLAEGDEGDSLYAAAEDTAVYVDVEVAALSRDGKLLPELRLDPIRIDEPFIYPEEAYRGGWEGWLIFQVLLDPFGEVQEYELKTKSPNEQINLLVEETFVSMAWDPTRIPQELQETWLYYRFLVQKPDHLK
ncbi:MAG: hypothetical protein KAW46_07365 [candidate division Zixibacteria bacterium]|nr:hypothetical protein [candidate division Zixibacteria bacterium]